MQTNLTDVVGLVRRQSALVRSLSDEVGRHSSSNFLVTALREQLREEETRLAKLLAISAAA